MASSGTIKEYLIGLGVDIKTKEFFVTIDNMTKAVAKFTLGLQGMVSALKGALIATASALENLYYIAQRAGTTVDGLKALQFGMRQIGLSAADANQALESLAMAMRLNPGNESLLRYLGVATRDARGAMRDTTQVTGDFIARLSKMPFFIAAQYAEMFGISSRTLYMLLQNFDKLKIEEKLWRDTARQLGVDLDASASKSRDFMSELRRVMETIELLWIKVSTVLIDRLRPELEAFRQFLLAHADQITEFAIRVGNAVMNASDDFLKLVPVIDDLISKTIGWQKALELVADVIAYRLFGPLGLVLMLMHQVYQWYEGEREREAKEGGPKDKPGFSSLQELWERIQKNSKKNNTDAQGGPLPESSMWDWLKQHRDPVTGQWDFLPDAAPRDPSTLPDPTLRAQPQSAPAPNTSIQPTDIAFRTGPLGVRQNNPGNLRRWEGAGSANGFAVFGSAMQGLVAMRDNLLAYARRGLDTVSGIVNRWAPSSENDTGSYIKQLAASLGVRANDHLDMQDPKILSALMSGITRIEQGGNPYGQSMIDQAARAPLGGSTTAGRGAVTIQQKTDIHVQGGESHSTAREVERSQERINASLVRGFRTAVIA